MKDILGITQHNITKPDSYSNKVSQRLKREILTLAKQLGIRNLKDLRRHPLFRSHFTKAIKFTESGRYDKACNSYEQIIFSILKILQRKKIDTHYKDTLNIRSQNEMIRDMGVKDRKIDRLQKEACLDKMGKNVIQRQKVSLIRAVEKWKMAVLQQKLDQSDRQNKELQQKLYQNISQMNKLKQLASRYQMNAKLSGLENAKYNFRKRKDEMLIMLDSINPSGLEKNGYNNIRRLLCYCEQAKLPEIEGNCAETKLQEYYDNFTFRNVIKKSINPFTIIGSVYTSAVTNIVAGSNKDKYLTAINFLRRERISHISEIQGLEKSIMNSAIPYCTELDNLLI